MTADAVGGIWTYAMELAAGLSARGIEVVLATVGPEPTDEQKKYALSIPGLALEVSRYKLEWMEEPWHDVDRAGDWLIETAARHAVDLVHLNGYAHGALAWRCPVLIAGHSCVLSWWHAVHGVDAPREWDRYRRRVTAGLERADCLVTPTQAFMECLQRWYAPKCERRVIRNARSAAQFAAAGEARQAIALACGRIWDQAKGLHLLDEIASDLPWPVYVAGDDTSPDGVSRSPASVRCVGRLDASQVAAWMKRATIFVHPARYEPFGLAVLEAALSGCAPVLADLPSLRELWSGAALFVNVDDPVELQRTLRSLMNDLARCRALGAAARARARQFAPTTMSGAYAHLYEEMLAKRAALHRVVA